MQIGAINARFGASIPVTSASKTIRKVLKNSTKNDEFVLPKITYNEMHAKINEVLPNYSDKVIFNRCEDLHGNANTYLIEGMVIHNKKETPFFTRADSATGSNLFANNIVSAIKRTLDK